MAAVLSIGTTTKRRRDRGGTRWEDCSCRFGRRIGQRKKQKEGYGISFKRPPLAETTQQPTENSTRWGGVQDSAAEERLGRTITRCLDGDSSNKKWNEKIHSVAVNGHQTMKTTHNNQQKTQGCDG